MAIQVYLTKRYQKGTRRNGQRLYHWAMRWRDPATKKLKMESTKTADKTLADEFLLAKQAEVNGLLPAAPEPEPEPEPVVGPTWQDCRDAIERAMRADNLRPGYIALALLVFDGLQAAYPELASPADVTPELANEYKRRRSELGLSPWTIKGQLSTLRGVFGKWLVKECGLLKSNPFEGVRPPKCDAPDVRIITADEHEALYAWLADRWGGWRLPLVYLDLLAVTGWRATETASIRAVDLLDGDYVRVIAANNKTRGEKFAKLPPELFAALKAGCAGGMAFGKFSDDLRRLLLVLKHAPHQASTVRDFTPDRLVHWLQDELGRFHAARAKEAAELAAETGRKAEAPQKFTLHCFRKTAITGLQMAGVSEKEASVLVGVTPEVARRHYENLDKLTIADRGRQKRLAASGGVETSIIARIERAGKIGPLDEGRISSQAVGA